MAPAVEFSFVAVALTPATLKETEIRETARANANRERFFMVRCSFQNYRREPRD
jgi:hypothetical protein